MSNKRFFFSIFSFGFSAMLLSSGCSSPSPTDSTTPTSIPAVSTSSNHPASNHEESARLTFMQKLSSASAGESRNLIEVAIAEKIPGSEFLEKDSDGNTIFHYLFKSTPSVATLKYILGVAEWSLSAENVSGLNAIHVAVESNTFTKETIEVLVESKRGQDALLMTEFSEQRNILHVLAGKSELRKHVEIILRSDLLFSLFNLMKNSEGKTPLAELLDVDRPLTCSLLTSALAPTKRQSLEKDLALHFWKNNPDTGTVLRISDSFEPRLSPEARRRLGKLRMLYSQKMDEEVCLNFTQWVQDLLPEAQTFLAEQAIEDELREKARKEEEERRERARVLAEKAQTLARNYFNGNQSAQGVAVITADARLVVHQSVDHIRFADMSEGALVVIPDSDPFIARLVVSLSDAIVKPRLLIWDYALRSIEKKNGITLYHTAKINALLGETQLKQNLSIDLKSLTKLGTGAHAEVYRWVYGDKSYALKVSSKGLLQSYEGEKLERLQFTNAVLGYYGAVKVNQRLAFILELGESDLANAIASKRAFSDDDLTHATKKMRRLVEALDQLGIPYTDIKPDNLIVVRDGQHIFIKAADFGFGISTGHGYAIGFELSKAILEAKLQTLLNARRGYYDPSEAYEKYLARRAYKDVLAQTDAPALNGLNDFFDVLTPTQRLSLTKPSDAIDGSLLWKTGLIIPQFDEQIDWQQFRIKLDHIYGKLQDRGTFRFMVDNPKYEALVHQGRDAFMKQLDDDNEFKEFIYALYDGAARSTISHIVESRYENNFQAIINEALSDAFSDKNDTLRIELIALAAVGDTTLFD